MLRNCYCPLFGYIPKKATKTIYNLTVIITEQNTTLYAEVDDNINNFLAEVCDDLGQKFVICKTQTFKEPGTYKVLFESEEYGAIISNINTINKILNPIKGWDGNNGSGVNNPEPPISIGQQVETDEEIRLNLLNIRFNSIFNREKNNLLQTLEKSLKNIGCLDVKCYLSRPENNLKDYGIPIGCIYIVCVGGNDEDIFSTIYSNTVIETVGSKEKIYWMNTFPVSVKFDKITLKSNKILDEDLKNKLLDNIYENFNKKYSKKLISSLNINHLSSIITDYINSTINTSLYSIYIENAPDAGDNSKKSYAQVHGCDVICHNLSNI